jgi:beta-lactamase regulating signal transducer with metallopeptidase domain
MTSFTDMLSALPAQRLGWTLLHSLWQFAVIGLMLWGILALLRRRTANLRYLLACGALLAMLAGSVVTFQMLHETAATYRPIASVQSRPIVAQDLSPATDSIRPAPSSMIEAATEKSERIAGTPNIPAESTASILKTTIEAMEPWLPWISLAWLGGVVVLSLRNLGGWIGVRRLRRVGNQPAGRDLAASARALIARMMISRPVRIVQSALVEVPIVVGWLKPVILMPLGILGELSPAQLEAILAHELAHVRRHDYLVNLLQTVLETLFFYHPAVWWVSRRIRVEREHCCDDAAVGVCGSGIGLGEALTLLASARLKINPALAASGGSLVARVRRIITRQPEGPDRHHAWLAGVILGGIVLAGTIVLGGATKEPASRVPAETETPWGKPLHGLHVQASVKQKTWRIGEAVPVVNAVVDVINPKAYQDSGLMEKKISHDPAAFALEIDGNRYEHNIAYGSYPVPLMSPFRCSLDLDERWDTGRIIPPIGFLTPGTPLELAPGKHTVKVLFTALGQDPAPASEPLEIEILPADKTLTPWKAAWGEAVRGVQVGAVAVGPDPALVVRVRNSGDGKHSIHKGPGAFVLEIDGQRYEDTYIYMDPAWRMPFDNGDEYEITVPLGKNWVTGRHWLEQKSNEMPGMSGKGVGQRLVPGKPLEPLTSGKHIVRVILNELGENIRPSSPPVEIDMTAKPKGATNVPSSQAQAETEAPWGKPLHGLQVQASVKQKTWRIGEAVPAVNAVVDVINPKAYRDSGLMEKTMVHAQSAFALEIDGKRYDDNAFYTAWPVSLMSPFRFPLVLDEQWKCGPFKTAEGYVALGTPLEFAPGKHAVKVLFTALGQDPAPASEPLEIEILPADKTLTPWKAAWGEAVQGVQVGAIAVGPEPALVVRVRNSGDGKHSIHKRPGAFILEVDGQRYEDPYVHPAWRMPFDKGDEYEISVPLGKEWVAGPLPGRPLEPLTSGKHTLRVILNELGENIRPSSPPVEIDVTGPGSGDYREPGKKELELSQSEQDLPLPTCYIPLKELATKSKGALVATLLDVGSPELGPPGASDYLSRWETDKVLWGDYPGMADLDFRVQTIPEQHRERMPAIGKKYILICYDSNANQIACIFDYTDAKLREIEDLLNSRVPAETETPGGKPKPEQLKPEEQKKELPKSRD